jgi:hypothetical protein
MSTRFKLSAMMFLEFFIWGAWYPLIFGYLPSLGYSGDQPPAELAGIIPDAVKGYFSEQALILIVFNVSALVALFFSTQFADRNFAAERFLAFSQLVGGLAMLGLFFIRRPDPDTPAPFWPFFGLLLLHSLFYVPTISITNSIAFANVKDAQKEFGPIRLWGTIGWIAAAWPMFFVLINWTSVPAFGAVGVVEWFRAALDPANAKTGDEFRQASSYWPCSASRCRTRRRSRPRRRAARWRGWRRSSCSGTPSCWSCSSSRSSTRRSTSTTSSGRSAT